jgi:hypothetical protein
MTRMHARARFALPAHQCALCLHREMRAQRESTRTRTAAMATGYKIEETGTKL